MEATDRIIAADLLDRTAARIERTDLHKGGYYEGWTDTLGAISEPAEIGTVLLLNPELPCCTQGGLYYAAAVKGVSSLEAERALVDHLGLTTPNEIPSWNDARERTADEVIAAMRETAECLRAEVAA